VTYYNVPSHPLSRTQRVVLLVILVATYVWTVTVFFRPVQLRVLNSFAKIDLAIMAGLILPFMLAPLYSPLLAVTRVAWGISAIMALDLVFFAMMEFGPLGSGHPSLEALGSVYLGVAKLVLIPATLILLAIANIRGERIGIIALGFICLTGVTLYATYPPF
jgi:hypothetical protein